MSKTDKTGNSGDFDGHMSDEDKLRKDALKQQQQHMEKVRMSKGRPPKFGGGKDPDESKPATLADEEDDRKQLLILDPKLILGLRIYSRNPDGSPCGQTVKTDKFMAKHRQIRRERDSYLDHDGTHVEVGKLIRERKGRYVEEPKMLGGERERARRAPAVLKSIMARLMPHEAELATGELSGELLDAVMDRAVTEFQSATGCEIISAAAHRMSDYDLHIHIQYTMVVAEQKKPGKYSAVNQEWEKEASRMAREELLKKNVKEPNPSAIGAMKRKLKKEGKLKPAPATRLVYRKIKGRRKMGNGIILGHSFRNKLNLVRLAQSAGDFALGERVIAKKDDLRGFDPISRKTDEELENRYLDLWLERVWRNSVKARLSEDTLERIRAAGIEAAKDYSDFGTSMPEAFDIEQRKFELQHEAAENEWERQFLEYDNERYRAELEEAAKDKMEALEIRALAQENKLLERQKLLDDQKAILDGRETSLQNREQVIEKVQKSAEESRQQAESLRVEVNELTEKANLCDRLIEFLKKIIDIPGLGLHLRKITSAWVPLKKLGPELGIVTKLEAIEAIKDHHPKKHEREGKLPGNRG